MDTEIILDEEESTDGLTLARYAEPSPPSAAVRCLT